MTELFVLEVICRHGDVQTKIRTDSPTIPAGLVAVHNTERPQCAPHFVRRMPAADPEGDVNGATP